MYIYIFTLKVIIITQVTVSSVKSTDVTCKKHSGYLATQLSWQVYLASLVCDVNLWLCDRVSALRFLVRSPVGQITVYTADNT